MAVDVVISNLWILCKYEKFFIISFDDLQMQQTAFLKY